MLSPTDALVNDIWTFPLAVVTLGLPWPSAPQFFQPVTDALWENHVVAKQSFCCLRSDLVT